MRPPVKIAERSTVTCDGLGGALVTAATADDQVWIGRFSP